MVFINLGKAYNNVLRDLIWWVFRQKECLMDIIQPLILLKYDMNSNKYSHKQPI